MKEGKSTPKVTIIETPAPLVSTFTPNEGELHIVALDANGIEIAGSDFSISQKQYNKTYSGNPKFIVKKNLQQ